MKEFIEFEHPRNNKGRFIKKYDEKLVQFAKDAIAGKATAPKEYIVGDISEDQRKKIEDALGRPIEATVNVISAERIVHINKRHGSNGTANHQMANIDDYGLIQYVLETGECKRVTDPNETPLFSRQYNTGGNSPAPLVMFSKQIDKEYIVVEAICDGTKRGAIRIESVYTKK